MSRAHLLIATFLIGLAALAGCGGSQTTSYSPSAMAPAGEAAAGRVQDAPVKPGGAGDEAPITRKIIYTASLEVVVKNLDDTRKDVERIVDEHKGYIAKSDVTGSVGSKRSATWTLKIPAEKFRVAVTALAALGNAVRNTSDSQDVTEEYVDVQARIKNLKAEEETLNKLLKEQAVRLEDVLKIRDQIKNVRGDIERAEGRLKYLATMSAVSTITLTAREEATYIPEQPSTAPSFMDRVGSTWHSSTTALVNFGENIALLAVALAPWLIPIAVVVVFLWWLVKRLVRTLDRPQPLRPERRPPRARPLPPEERATESAPQQPNEERPGSDQPSTGG